MFLKRENPNWVKPDYKWNVKSPSDPLRFRSNGFDEFYSIVGSHSLFAEWTLVRFQDS
jgi:hypothetical protein